MNIDKYNDPLIIRRLINNRFTFFDVDPKVFPKMAEGFGLYCPFHQSTHTGDYNARLYLDEDTDQFILYCYVEGKAFTVYDYVNYILCQQKQLYKAPRDYALANMSKQDFIAFYTLYQEQVKDITETQFKKKCEYINNTYVETGNTIDYIEQLYTA